MYEVKADMTIDLTHGFPKKIRAIRQNNYTLIESSTM